MNDLVRQAFLLVRDGYSPDRVVVDPDLNRAFIKACRVAGLVDQPAMLNACLFKLRKTGRLTGLPQSRRTSFSNEDEYSFASEIAARFLERRDDVTLDQILCDPVRVEEFDRIASQIAPGFSPLQYRWAALNLRKSKRLRPEPLGRVLRLQDAVTCPVRDLNVGRVPVSQGLYFFFDSTQTLYVGETTNLRKRILKHLEHSDNKGLAHWLWGHGPLDLHLEYHLLPLGTTNRQRKAMETELIRSRKPVFNVASLWERRALGGADANCGD